MGLDDIWGEICRFFIDVSAYLDAGQKAAKYERTAEKLERKIKSCQEKLDDICVFIQASPGNPNNTR